MKYLLFAFAALCLMACSEDKFDISQDGVQVQAKKVGPNAMPAADAKAGIRVILRKK